MLEFTCRDFLVECVRYEGIWSGYHTQLTCRIFLEKLKCEESGITCSLVKIDDPDRSRNLNIHSNLPKNLSHQIPHFIQVSVAAHEPCTLQCLLLDCNGTKWTRNALSIPAAACSQQILGERKFWQVVISLLVWYFSPMIWMCLWQIW